MVPVSVFFPCRFCSLRQNAGCATGAGFASTPGRGCVQAPPQLQAASSQGRDLPVAGFRVKTCTGVWDEVLCPTHSWAEFKFLTVSHVQK